MVCTLATRPCPGVPDLGCKGARRCPAKLYFGSVTISSYLSAGALQTASDVSCCSSKRYAHSVYISMSRHA